MVSALCTALTLSLFARALMSTLRHLALAEERLAALLSLAASLWLAQTPLFFEQAVRPQVFALQFALSMLIIYTLLRFEEEEPHGSTRVLYFGAFLQGLSFANHHVYSLLLLPVAAPTLGRVFARRGFVGLMGYLAAPIVGFSAYLYVPLRLAHMPESGLAKQSGFVRTLAILGEEPYAGPGWAAPSSAGALLREGLSLPRPGQLVGFGLLLALGLWLALRNSHQRRFGTLWFLAFLVPFVSVSSVLSLRVREDAWGALMPAACALTAIASCGVAYLCNELAAPFPRALKHALGASAVALALAALVTRDGGDARAEDRLADEADEQARRRLAPNAVLFNDEASSAFWFQGREAEEGLRADVTLVPLALRARPHLVESWAEQTPELAEALRALVLSAALDLGSLQSLNALRPVYLEPSGGLSRSVRASAVPEGLLLRIRSEGVTKRDTHEAEALNAERLSRLTKLSGALPEHDLARAKIARDIAAEAAP
jgi:hypothetical protein